MLNNLDIHLEESRKDIDNIMKSLVNKNNALVSSYDLIDNHLVSKDEVILNIIILVTHDAIGAIIELLWKQSRETLPKFQY